MHILCNLRVDRTEERAIQELRAEGTTLIVDCVDHVLIDRQRIRDLGIGIGRHIVDANLRQSGQKKIPCSSSAISPEGTGFRPIGRRLDEPSEPLRASKRDEYHR